MVSRENTLLVAPIFTSECVLDPKPAEVTLNLIPKSTFTSLEQPRVPDYEAIYPTGFGNLTFSELYAATNRIVAFALRNQIGMNNPEDIDDCMQSGYLKVWEQLQKQPEIFAGKPKKYVIQAVVLRSKAQRYAHLRHYRKIVYDAEAQAHQNISYPTISQVDTWIDLAGAIQRVAEYTAALDKPIYLLALYTLITEVKTQDVAQTSEYGLSTLTAAKRRVRATLVKELPDYGNVKSSAEPLLLPKVQSFQSAQLQKQLITPILLDDTPLHFSLVKPHTNLLRCLPSVAQQYLEIQNPLDREEEVKYETRWRGEATFEDLLSDTQVRKVAYAKMRSLGYTDEDAEDCFQLGSLNLWKALKEQPTLLADKGAAWIGVWIAFSGSRRELWKHKAHCVFLNDPDERGSRPERWAGFATRIDEHIDFELLINALAQRYDGDLLKLYALYSLITSVKMKDVVSVAGAHKNQMVEARNEVKADIRELLEQEAETEISEEFWKDQLKRGNNLECVTRVAESVMENQRLLLALYVVTTSAKRKDVTELFGIGITAFRKDIIQIKLMLAEEFRKAKLDKTTHQSKEVS